mgnify:CR=1 FL=1
MDGRTDIAWHDSIGFRLAEKAERMKRFIAAGTLAIQAGNELGSGLINITGCGGRSRM